MNFDVSVWLSHLGLRQYIDTFRDQGIDELSLRELSDVELRELGVSSMGHRKMILREAAKPIGEGYPISNLSQSKITVPQTIFLSYAHKSLQEEDFDISEDLVLLIKEKLQQDGHTVWIDKEGIRAGSQWRERITSAILEHAYFLSFLSARSVRDPGVCLNEIAIALGGHKHIQTVLAEDELRVAPPLTISHIQWHDFQHWREIRDGTKTGPLGEEWDTWFGERMKQLCDVIADSQNASIPGELQNLREILEPRTFEARIVEKTNGFSGRSWLFEETQNWLEKSTSRMFWLKAGPGIGKSSFAAHLAHQARSVVVGFFMCDFQGKKDPEESAREAVCTLAFQLASRLPDYRLKLLYGLHLSKDKVQKRTADELFEYLITEPLNRSGKIPESSRLCLVVDGLDEAGRADGSNSLAELLAKHAGRLPEWLGVLVTSRPEPYLVRMLKPLSSIAIDGESAQNRQDLADWIDKRLPISVEGAKRLRFIDQIIDKSGGTFLYLSLVEKDESLDLTEPDRLPDQLDGIFKQNFNRYFSDTEEYLNKTEPFLRLMSAAPGPLPALMGANILGWGQRKLMINVIDPMGSLLNEREGGLTFFHASLRDWLKDQSRSGAHCIESGGAQELGDFIWCEFDSHEQSQWAAQVIDWMSELAPHTNRWTEPDTLSQGAEFLEKNRRYIPARGLRRRVLHLLQDESSAKAIALERLANNYTESAIGDGGRSNFEHAIELLKSAWCLSSKIHGPFDPLTLMTLAKIPFGEAGLYVEGRRALETVLENSQSLSQNEIQKVQAHYAYYLYEAGDYEASNEIYRRLLDSCAPATIARVTALSLVGFIEYELGNWSASKNLSEQALTELEAADQKSSTVHLSSTIKLNLAMCLSAMGLHELAQVKAMQAEAGFSEVMPDSYPWWGSIWVDMGLMMLAAGQIAEASKLADKAAKVSEAELGEEHFEPTCAWMLQARIYLNANNYDSAISLIKRALRVRNQTLPPLHWRTLAGQENLAYVLRSQGKMANSDEIALRWANDLTSEFIWKHSSETAVRIACRISEALWRANDRLRATDWVSLAIERTRTDSQHDLLDRLIQIHALMKKGINNE